MSFQHWAHCTQRVHETQRYQSDISCPEDGLVIKPEAMPDMFLLTSSDIFWHLLTSIGDLGVNAVASEEFSPRVPSWGVPPPAIAGEDAAEKEKVREEGWGGPGLAEHKRYKNGRSFKHSKAEDKICMSLYGINQQGGGWCRAAGHRANVKSSEILMIWYDFVGHGDVQRVKTALGISRQDNLKTVEDQKHSRVLEAKAHRSLLKGRSPEWSMQDGPAYETYRDVAWSFYPRLARQLL